MGVWIYIVMKSFMKLPKYIVGGKIKGDETGVNYGTYCVENVHVFWLENIK
jgi:hypothetical protein